MTMPGRLGEGWVESLTWRRNSVSSVRGVMMVIDGDGDGDDGACICCSIQDHISTTCVQSVMHFIITFFKLHAKMTLLG